MAPTPRDWSEQTRIGIIQDPDWDHVSPASPTELARFEAESGMPLPHDYCLLASTVGPGTLSKFFVFLVPFAEFADVDLVSDNAQRQRELQQVAERYGMNDHLQKSQRMIHFCTNYLQQRFAWDPQDVTDADKQEYGIYFVSRRPDRSPERVAGSFSEFIQSFCLGGGYEKKFGVPQLPVEDPGREYHPRPIRFKRSLLARQHANERRSRRQRVVEFVREFTTPGANRQQVLDKYDLGGDSDNGALIQCDMPYLELRQRDLLAVAKTLAEETRLESLTLAAGLSDQALVALQPLRSLKSLHLSCCDGTFHSRIRGRGLKALCEMEQLRSLSLYCPHIKNSGFRHLPQLPAVKELILIGLAIDDRSLPHLAQQVPGVERLVVQNSGISEESGTQVTGTSFGAFRDLQQIQSLELRYSPITDAGLAALPPLNRLTELVLTGTRITGAGLEHLARHANITRLELDFTQVADEGLQHLQRLPHLQWLRLVSTPVTDAGLPALAKIPKLRDVNCSLSQVSVDGAQWFRKTVRRCTISLRDP